jgi:hypothetical protein
MKTLRLSFLFLVSLIAVACGGPELASDDGVSTQQSALGDLASLSADEDTSENPDDLYQVRYYGDPQGGYQAPAGNVCPGDSTYGCAGKRPTTDVGRFNNRRTVFGDSCSTGGALWAPTGAGRGFCARYPGQARCGCQANCGPDFPDGSPNCLVLQRGYPVW